MATVLITGASRGIGAATARLFVEEGHRVILNYHTSKQAAQQLTDELNTARPCAEAICADVSDPAQVEAMFSRAEARFGPVDVLVNNAGVAWQGLLTDMTAAQWDALFAVNVGGMFHCCKRALPGMIHKKQGCIVNLSSIWGIAGASCEAAYSASKAAVIGLTRALAKEVGPSGIRVNCVAPGVVDTDMNAALDAETLAALREDTPLGVIGTPDDIAASIAFLASPRAQFITGQVLSPNGGYLI